jgi:hypothetical protein
LHLHHLKRLPVIATMGNSMASEEQMRSILRSHGLRRFSGSFVLLLQIAISSTLACQNVNSAPHLQFRSNALRISSSIFDIYYTPEDKVAAQDVALELTRNLPRLRKELGYDYGHRVAVEIYPNQTEYDTHLMNAAVRGSPACSGNRTIQMVSPRSPIIVPGLPYESRLGMAVHELVHLFIDEINPRTPVWLDEGIASYEGGADGYRKICKIPAIAAIIVHLPSSTALESKYEELKAADVISFTFVDFVVSTRGMGALRALLRNPTDLERILGKTRTSIDSEWHEFVIKTVGDRRKV